jgi:hypothetical protein
MKYLACKSRIANRSIDSERAQVSSRVEPLLNAVEFIEQDIRNLQNNVTHLCMY